MPAVVVSIFNCLSMCMDWPLHLSIYQCRQASGVHFSFFRSSTPLSTLKHTSLLFTKCSFCVCAVCGFAAYHHIQFTDVRHADCVDCFKLNDVHCVCRLPMENCFWIKNNLQTINSHSSLSRHHQSSLVSGRWQHISVGTWEAQNAKCSTPEHISFSLLVDDDTDWMKKAKQNAKNKMKTTKRCLLLRHLVTGDRSSHHVDRSKYRWSRIDLPSSKIRSSFDRQDHYCVYFRHVSFLQSGQCEIKMYWVSGCEQSRARRVWMCV